MFDGKYVSGDVDQDYLEQLNARRNDQAQAEESNGFSTVPDEASVVDLYNDNS